MIIKYHEEKINFIDEHDHYLGFDMESQCCEDFGWDVRTSHWNGDTVISDYTMSGDLDEETLAGYFFPNNFMLGYRDPDEEYESGGYVSFLLQNVDIEKPDLFLTLYNTHNGYYGHCWDFCKNDTSIESGEL